MPEVIPITPSSKASPNNASQPNGFPVSDIEVSPDTRTLTKQLQDFPEPITPTEEPITPLRKIMKTENYMSHINPEDSEDNDEEKNEEEVKKALDSEEESRQEFKNRIKNLGV